MVERTGRDLELPQSQKDLVPYVRREAILDPADEHEPVSIIVVPNGNVGEAPVVDPIAADDQFLAPVHLELDPCATASLRLVMALNTLGDDTLQAVRPHRGHKGPRCEVENGRTPHGMPDILHNAIEKLPPPGERKSSDVTTSEHQHIEHEVGKPSGVACPVLQQTE